MADASMTTRFPRVALFDLDGTLLDSAPDMVATADRMLGARGRPPVDAAMLRQHVSRGARAMVAAVFPALDEAGRDALVPEFLQVYREDADNPDINVGWEETTEDHVVAPAYEGLTDLQYAKALPNS